MLIIVAYRIHPRGQAPRYFPVPLINSRTIGERFKLDTDH